MYILQTFLGSGKGPAWQQAAFPIAGTIIRYVRHWASSASVDKEEKADVHPLGLFPSPSSSDHSQWRRIHSARAGSRGRVAFFLHPQAERNLVARQRWSAEPISQHKNMFHYQSQRHWTDSENRSTEPVSELSEKQINATNWGQEKGKGFKCYFFYFPLFLLSDKN